jgi:ABC-type transport system involved in multi-copper enzyme maturation permease subunit
VARSARESLFLGFGSVIRKELAEWGRGRGPLVIGGVSIAAAVFTTIIPFIAPPTPGMPELSRDATTNVLLGWAGLTAALVAILSTMSLIPTERDRGTLAWTLSQPVSPTSILAAKFGAAFIVLALAAVIVPLAVSSVVATIAYGSVPDVATIALFATLYLTVPAFYVALTVALGTGIRGTAGIAGIGFLVLFLVPGIGGLVPIVKDVSPTSIGTWAMAVATGQPASTLTLAGWLAGMTLLALAAKLAFDRQEF